MWIRVQAWDDAFTSIFDSGASAVAPTDGAAIYPNAVGRCTAAVVTGGKIWKKSM